MKRQVFVASDHAGFEFKQELLQLPQFKDNSSFEFVDLGPSSADRVDYPDFADQVAKRISSSADSSARPASGADSSARPASSAALAATPIPDAALAATAKAIGVLICGSGVGMSIRANRYPHVRAVLCMNAEVARLSRQHNDANVICFGARLTTVHDAADWLEIFLTEGFEGGRHTDRVKKIDSPLK